MIRYTAFPHTDLHRIASLRGCGAPRDSQAWQALGFEEANRRHDLAVMAKASGEAAHRAQQHLAAARSTMVTVRHLEDNASTGGWDQSREHRECERNLLRARAILFRSQRHSSFIGYARAAADVAHAATAYEVTLIQYLSALPITIQQR